MKDQSPTAGASNAQSGEPLDTYKSDIGNPSVEPHRWSLGAVRPRRFEDKNSSLSLLNCRRTLSSAEVAIELEGLEADLEQVFYVDLHACHGGHLGYLQFVRYEGLRYIDGDPDFRAKASYGLQAILLPGTPCPGPLRLLPGSFVSYEPSPGKAKGGQ